MFGLTRKQHPAQDEADTTDIAPPVMQPETPAEAPHTALLQRWMSLADVQQRVIKTLASEIARTSTYVESEGDALSQTFQQLATSAQQQTARVDSLTNMARGVEVDGQMVPMEEIVVLLENTLADVVVKILLLSKDSMSMVYALDILNDNVHSVEKCNGRIDSINSTMTMLALNARIEAERAGSAGLAFRVVANEVRELSTSTKQLAATMDAELKAIMDGITTSHATLKKIATVDMSDNILVKERVEILLKALIERNNNLGMTVADAVSEAGAISASVDAMVTGIQFQDRAKQRLEHVIDTLNVITQAIEEVKISTVAAVPGLMEAVSLDTSWLTDLLGRYTMSDMRERFVAQILADEPMEWPEDAVHANEPASSGSMELF